MLEQSSLLIQHDAAGTRWNIQDGASRRLLGFARWRSPHGSAVWRWFTGPVLEVFEAGDEPLVFTIRKLWGFTPRWEVSDADGRRVALVYPGSIFGASGQCTAIEQQQAQTIQFRDLAGETSVAAWTDEGVLLTFAPDTRENPLIKMAFLAAILCRIACGRNL
jgi:hypothetical protein